jgi:hypothetical protein
MVQAWLSVFTAKAAKGAAKVRKGASEFHHPPNFPTHQTIKKVDKSGRTTPN